MSLHTEKPANTMSHPKNILAKGRANIDEDGFVSEQHGSQKIEDGSRAIQNSPRHPLLTIGPSKRETKPINPVLGPTLPNGQPRRRRRELAGPLSVPLAPRVPQCEINDDNINYLANGRAHDKPSLKGHATICVVPVHVMAVSAKSQAKRPELVHSHVINDQNNESSGIIRAVDREKVQKTPNDQRSPKSPSPESNGTNRRVPIQVIPSRTTASSTEANATNSVEPVQTTTTTTSTRPKTKRSMLLNEVIKNVPPRQDRKMTVIVKRRHTTKYARIFRGMVQGVHKKKKSRRTPNNPRTTPSEEAPPPEETTETGTDAVGNNNDNDNDTNNAGTNSGCTTNNNSSSTSEDPANNNETNPPPTSSSNPPDNNHPSTKWFQLPRKVLNAPAKPLISAIHYIPAHWPSAENRKREEQWAEATRMWKEDAARRTDRVMREVEEDCGHHPAYYRPLVPVSPPSEIESYKSCWVKKTHHEGWGWGRGRRWC